ncbi:competence protein CoiA family protein [Halopiger aswanensis]|uniref:Competence protein CoiA-like protein n=1 Tax=Halopiger aswanensis TaxID=148449 RepID=A0A419VUP4_9EURY|nr:hypothetical protein [Halopiger aswanensis]RKD85219.1 hypothetical protein ATJ93_4721 [Halopiger aswanensis]
MSFLALRESDGASVLPEEVDNGVDVECPTCGETMRARGPSKDGRARHFFHRSDTDCPGGESDVHRKQKSLAVSAFRVRMTEYIRCGLEVEVDVSDTRTGVDTRRADALLEFEDEHQIFGNGLIIEVQYRNHNKNIPATTFDYLSKGYSIIWANQDTFTDNRFLLDEVIVDFDSSGQTYRPAVTEPEDLLPLEPPTLTGTKYYFDERADGPETPGMRSEDECDHRWVEQYEYCYQCSECEAKLHANPSIFVEDDSVEQESRVNENGSKNIGYVISLEENSFEDISTYHARGELIEIRGRIRECTECGTEYVRIIGWDGGNLYSAGRLHDHLAEKPYISYRKVNGQWKMCCPNCGDVEWYRWSEQSDLYYSSSQIDTIWIPEDEQIVF